MLFKDIIGQKEIKQHLVELVQHNRLSHALLFLGKEGSGALPLALTFAQYIGIASIRNNNAAPDKSASLFGEEAAALTETEGMALPESPDEADHWMQQQPAYSKVRDLVHPDIHFSYPVITKKPGTAPISADYISEWREFVKSYPYGNAFDWLQFIGAENKQGNITASECNDIIRRLSLKSFESENKILVMWMPEYLGNEGNKLLKLIEEPPLNTIFILVAESEALILPTILSRCQLLKIPALETKDIEQALITRNKTDLQLASQAASVSEGNYREALQILRHAEEDWQSLLREWLNAILKTGPIAQTKWVEEISRLGREKQKQFLRYFNHLLEQAVRVRVMAEDSAAVLVIPEKERDFADRLNKIADLAQQQVMVEELDKAAYYIERNANPKILFHALTIKLYHIIQDKLVFLTY